MPRIRFHSILISSLLALLSLGGCASLDSAGEADRPSLAEFDANMGQGVVLARLLGLDGSRQRQADEQRQRITELERQLEAERQAAGTLNEKFGLIIVPTKESQLADALDQAFAAAKTKHPVTLVSAAEMADLLASYDCQADHTERCAAQLLSYPGTQLLLVVTQLEQRPDKAIVTVRPYDAALGVQRPASTAELAVEGGRVSQQELLQFAEETVAAALAMARATPWSTRAFRREGDEFFLAAGERSGLKPGMLLSIHNPGRTVPAPTGGIAGWIPGAKKGALKVTALFGSDYAIAELLEGEPPSTADPLLLSE